MQTGRVFALETLRGWKVKPEDKKRSFKAKSKVESSEKVDGLLLKISMGNHIH